MFVNPAETKIKLLHLLLQAVSIPGNRLLVLLTLEAALNDNLCMA